MGKTKKRNVIGEGSYGCVHKPSLMCSKLPKRAFNYDSHVSKIMQKEEANLELKEILILGKMDPENKYHLGKPVLCTPKINKETIYALSDCDYIEPNDVKKNINNYRLLISKYGGEDLHQFFKYSLKSFLASNKQDKIDKILFEIHNLLMGLYAFKKAGLVHNDLKPHNILFHPETCSMKFIDFGLMRPKKEVVQLSKKSDNWLSIFHWSLPFECAFMNKNAFSKYKKMSFNERKKYRTELADCIIFEKTPNPFDLNSPDAFKILFTYINPTYVIPDEETQYGFIYSSFQGLNELISKKSYEDILNLITDSIDVFGLGMTLQFIVNSIHREVPFKLIDFTHLTSFFSKMYNFNLNERIIDIDSLIREYETILLEMGVLSRLGKSFCKHKTLNSEPIPDSIYKKISKTKKASKKLSVELEKNAYLNPVSTLKCPDGQERNHRTGQCTKPHTKTRKRSKSKHRARN